MTTFKDIESAAERFHDVQLQEHLDDLDREDNRKQCVEELYEDRVSDRAYRIDAVLSVIDGDTAHLVVDLVDGDGFDRTTAKSAILSLIARHIYDACNDEVK